MNVNHKGHAVAIRSLIGGGLKDGRHISRQGYGLFAELCSDLDELLAGLDRPQNPPIGHATEELMQGLSGRTLPIASNSQSSADDGSSLMEGLTKNLHFVLSGINPSMPHQHLMMVCQLSIKLHGLVQQGGVSDDVLLVFQEIQQRVFMALLVQLGGHEVAWSLQNLMMVLEVCSNKHLYAAIIF